MKLIILVLLFGSLIFSCTSSKDNAEASISGITPLEQQQQETFPEEVELASAIVPADTSEVDDMQQYIDEATVTSYLLVADSSKNYADLEQKMKVLAAQTGQKIDLMDRVYDAESQQIILPLDHADEIYAGTYFPRRYGSDDLSLEQLSFYDGDASDNTIALVAGLIGDPDDAEARLATLQKTHPDAFLVEARIYMGCMH